jgi:RNA polymerase sigma-70 factor (ECF subfamily)
VALTAVDRSLLQRCLQKEPGSWNDFVDRFLGLIYHTIHYTAHLRSVPLTPEEVEDLAQEVLVQVVANDYAVLKQFRGHSSLATYLTVIARRISVRELNRRAAQRQAARQRVGTPEQQEGLPAAAQASLESLEEVQKLLKKLPAREREVVRLFYLEGRTYEEISTELDIPVNTIGPILARVRKRLAAGTAGKAPPPKVVKKTQEPEPQ